MKALAPVNIALSLPIRDGTGVISQSLLSQSNQVRPAEWPLSPVPGPSTRAEPIEQPAFEVPRRSSRVQQQRQRPDNVYGDDPFVDHLTDSQ